ncbi:MAG: VWA domain-containing protein [Rhodoferax sp.]
MEEHVGRWWHRAITHLARQDHPHAAVHLSAVQHTLALLLRAAGGPAQQRLAPASAQSSGGPRRWLQALAGQAQRAELAQWEPDVLALPPVLAVFEHAERNRDLYLWLAALGAHFDPQQPWLSANVQATQRALTHFPGLKPLWERLCHAHRAQRPALAALRGPARMAEATVQAALRGEVPAITVQPNEVAPVWLWFMASSCAPAPGAAAQAPNPEAKPGPQPKDHRRRRAQRTEHSTQRNPLIMPFRAEALMSWTEMVRVNRATDDSDDGNALAAADDMDQLSVAPDGQSLAARVKFDLDLPSASADDTPLGPGLWLPEWDWQRGALRTDHCRVQVMQHPCAEPASLAPALRRTARRLRHRLEVLRDAPRPLPGQDSGDDIDLDAWVRLHAETAGGLACQREAPPVYLRHAPAQRSLVTLLLADLSLSTDAYASEQQRIIDVIRDALWVFGEALSATGDAFALWGFSSVRRQQVRLQYLKNFDDRWAAPAQARVAAIRPGYYTRMGAAIRFATRELQVRPERQRLLMLLTDGKPNDLDAYEGRYGLEDTRAAVHAARAAGLTPFCVTIDETAHDYLPYLFGSQGYAMVRRPTELVRQLTQAWVQLRRR